MAVYSLCVTIRAGEALAGCRPRSSQRYWVETWQGGVVQARRGRSWPRREGAPTAAKSSRSTRRRSSSRREHHFLPRRRPTRLRPG